VVVPSHQIDDVPPGGALVFSLWKLSSGKYSVRVQFVVQTMDQMHDATRLTLENPPVIANLFVSGCSTAGEGYSCPWSRFKEVTTNAIDPAFVSRR
jgi:4-phytase / acid phosphatase